MYLSFQATAILRRAQRLLVVAAARVVRVRIRCYDIAVHVVAVIMIVGINSNVSLSSSAE